MKGRNIEENNVDYKLDDVKDLKLQIDQLKKQLAKTKQFVIDELERVKDFFVLEDEKGNIDITRDIFEVAEYVITKINELKGGKNGT